MKYFVANPFNGPRGWEVGETKSRNRICCDCTEEWAYKIAAMLNGVTVQSMKEMEDQSHE